MSVTSTWTAYPATEDVRLRLRPIHLGKEPLHLLSLPAEIRVEIYSYLLPNLPSYPNGISEPQTPHQMSLRQDSEPACTAILFTCRKVYHEAVSALYHKRCFNFDIAGHLLRSVANRHNRITTVNFRAWLGLSSHFKQHWPTYDIDNLHYELLEEVCVTFWPMHGCLLKLDDARQVTADLCRQLSKANGLKKLAIKFRDVWSAPQVTTATMTCRQMTEVEYLLQPFRILQGMQEVKIELPEALSSYVSIDDRTLQGQRCCAEEIAALIKQAPLSDDRTTKRGLWSER